MLTKQAKILTNGQIEKVLDYLSRGRNAARNRVMFLLSIHGLRSKEVSALELSMITDAVVLGGCYVPPIGPQF